MNKFHYILFLIIVLATQSCTNKTSEYSCDLVFSEQIEIPIDENTHYKSRALFTFIDTKTGREYLSFENNEKRQNEILVFDLETFELVKRITLPKEGPNAIHMLGHYPEDLENFYITSAARQMIYKINGEGKILRVFNYSASDKNEPLTDSNSGSFFHCPLIIKDSCFYLPQSVYINEMRKEDWLRTALCARLNMQNGMVEKMPLSFPVISTQKEIMTSDIPYGYSSEFDKDNFIYSFFMLDSIIVTKDNSTSQKYDVSSRYVKDIKPVFQSTSDDIVNLRRKTWEKGMYWHFIYDKYRDVYYRFVFFPCTFNKNDDVMKIASVQQEFSIIILNKDFEVIGETKFPQDKYFPRMVFLGSKGLYISENNPSNPEFDEDKLVFSCFVPNMK